MKDYGIYEKVKLNGIVPGRLIRHTRADSAIIKSHWHPELEINTVFEGSSRFFINGRIEDVTPSHVVVINSREVHSSIPFFPQGEICVTGVTIQICYDFLKKVIPDYDNCYFILNNMAERKIQLLLEEMNKKCKTQDAAYMNIYAIKQICEHKNRPPVDENKIYSIGFAANFERFVKTFWAKKCGILIKKESASLDFTELKIPRDYTNFKEEIFNKAPIFAKNKPVKSTTSNLSLYHNYIHQQPTL